MNPIIFLTLMIYTFSFGLAYGHTVDSVGEYRLEIGWMNEPVVSGETNGIELYVSHLKKDIPLKDQPFEKGIKGLEKSLKIQLVYDAENIILPLAADHNIPGKYYAFVDPTKAGYYQANVLGNIGETSVSISMHPPKVDERAYLEFPIKVTEERKNTVEDLKKVQNEISSLKESIDRIENSSQYMILGFVGIGLAIIGIGLAAIALRNKK